LKHINWKKKTKLFVISFISLLLLVSFSSILFHQNGNQQVNDDSDLSLIVNVINIEIITNNSIHNMTYNDDVTLKCNVTMINCTFNLGTSVSDNSTFDASRVVFTNCSFPGNSLVIGGNSTAIFANESGGENYINIFPVVTTYQNGTLIANRTIFQHYGTSPMFYGGNFGKIIFDNSTVNDFQYIFYDNSSLIIRNNSFIDSGNRYATFWTNSSINIDNSTFKVDQFNIHNNCSGTINNRSNIRVNDQITLDGDAVFDVFDSSYLDLYPAHVSLENFSIFSLHNSTMMHVTQSFEVHQNGTLNILNNSVYDRGDVFFYDNATINIINSTCGNRYESEEISVNEGFTTVNVQNSTLER